MLRKIMANYVTGRFKLMGTLNSLTHSLAVLKFTREKAKLAKFLELTCGAKVKSFYCYAGRRDYWGL